ncbi:MAG: hypothetical protein J6A49_10665 [Clostridia bacterium]|nr:hypothetical protein [Clostridia bacterium]
MITFRELTADEIDVRIGQVDKDGRYLTCLLYKDARCDMAILDKTVGAENWEREHYECKGNLFCKVGINTNYANESSQPNWVYKSDCGSESNTEKEKGEASDSFKRACVNWGIGRELYTAPFIYIPATDESGSPNFRFKNGKCKDKFVVTKIAIDKKKITGLAIWNTSINKRVFVYAENKGQ